MKIYCSRIYDNELDKFIGKDVWIKVIFKSNAHLRLDTSLYMRILRKEYSELYDTCYVANYVYATDDLTKYSYKWKHKFLSNTELIPVDEIELVEPMEIRTTEELFGII